MKNLMKQKLLSGQPVLGCFVGFPSPAIVEMLGLSGFDFVIIQTRHFSPFLHGESHYFLSINRNKKSVEIDLKSKEGKEVFIELVKKSDVLIENFRPGVLEKMGLGPEVIKANNKEIIICSISAFGQTGQYGKKARYDLIIQAMSGVMCLTGEEGFPVRCVLLACWYATRFPDAEIVGIDQSGNGIRCAKELAEQLGLSNVSFYRMDFMDLRERFLLNSFDLIISVRTFHEIMGPVFLPKYWSLPNYLKENPTYGDSRYLKIIDDLLTEDGTYLACERLENPADVGKWANSLRQANLHVQWDDCGIINYHEVGAKKCSPIIVVTKRETGMTTLEGMEHLYTKDSPLVLEAGESYSGAKAEFAYHRLGEKTFKSGRYLDVPDHWHMFRFEIWETNGFLLVYSYGNMGHRHLDILPAGAYLDAQLLIEEESGKFSHLGPIVQYNSLEERPESYFMANVDGK